MRLRSVRNLSDGRLIHEVRELTVQDRGTTAQLLVHLAEIDRRKLFLPAGYSSMYQFCFQEFSMSEDVAWKRIRTMRVARRFPEILTAIADGRLSLNSVVLLAPHIKNLVKRREEDSARELLKAAEGQTRSRIELLIAQRFPKPDLPTQITPAAAQPDAGQCTSFELAARPVFDNSVQPSAGAGAEIAEPREPAVQVPPTRVAPPTLERFGLQTTIDRETRDDLNRAQELLGPGSQVPDALKRALRLLVAHLEKQKFAAVARPRPQSHPGQDPRNIPAAVKRIVRERDKDRCTFVGDNGHRCEERSGLEFDHIVPVARGGGSNPENLRLRCHGHNQLEADRVFGAEFMNGKRRSAATG